MKAKIKEKKEVAADTLVVTFDLLGEIVKFNAGQFLSLKLSKMNYEDAKGNSRILSIVNSPDQNDILTIATRITDSAFKKTLKELSVGSAVEVGSISGAFVLPKNTDQPIVFITGGIGITPMVSMLRHIKAQNLDYKVRLAYSNRNQGATAFLVELQELDKQNSNFKLILIMTDDPDWSGEEDHINIDFIKKYIPDYQKVVYYVSGPPGMVSAIKKVLEGGKIEKKNIKFENFLGY